MFDNLVESSKHGKETSRTSVFLLGTFVVYGIGLMISVVGAILYFDPTMAGMLDVQTMLAPPPPPSAPPPPAPQVQIKNIPVPEIFAPPPKPRDIPDPSTVKARPVVQPTSTGVPGGVPGGM